MKKRLALITSAALCAGLAIGVCSADLIDSIRAEIRRDFTVVVDGKKQNFKNANGEAVYPVLYEGTTYLPVRAIGELMGKTVYWYEDDKRIELKEEKTTVTDADVIITDGDVEPYREPNNKPEREELVTELTLDEAKKIALKKAGLKETEVKFTKAKLDRDDGKMLYKIDFYHGTTEYEAEIDADTGDIISWEIDAEDEKKPADDEIISLAKAKKIALDKADLKESEVTFTKAELDRDDGRLVYEIEFVNGRTEFEAEIDAADGEILNWEIDD